MDDDNSQDATRLSGGSSPKAAPASGSGTFAPGQLISNGTYRIVQLVARGGMGEIYLATHELQGTEHALKTILPDLARDERITQLFLREARALSQIRHDAVVRYEDVFRDEQGIPFIPMEYLRGPSLADLSRERSLSADEVAMLCRRLAEGLAAAHAQDIVHRDISPDNVILPDGSIENAKLIDFGIAKDLAPQAGTLIGGDFA